MAKERMTLLERSTLTHPLGCVAHRVVLYYRPGEDYVVWYEHANGKERWTGNYTRDLGKAWTEFNTRCQRRDVARATFE